MGRPKGTNNQARERLIQAAGRSFRVGGFGGTGIDGLAKEAGLTSGAFYAHFDSKTEAFRYALVDGLDFLRNGVETMQRLHGANWVAPFIDFYLGQRLQVGLEEACGLPTFCADVARADDPTRLAFEQSLTRLVTTMATQLAPKGDLSPQDRAYSILAILSGAAGMARAVPSPELRTRLIASVQSAARLI